MGLKKKTGYPSIDKPWLSKYPELLFSQRKQYKNINENLRAVWSDTEKIIINYYDNNITEGIFLSEWKKLQKLYMQLE